MNTNYQKEFDAIIRKAQREILSKAIDAIVERNSRILKILNQGRPIYEQALGERFSRIYELRRMLWMKMEENDKDTALLWDMIQELHKEEG